MANESTSYGALSLADLAAPMGAMEGTPIETLSPAGDESKTPLDKKIVSKIEKALKDLEMPDLIAYLKDNMGYEIKEPELPEMEMEMPEEGKAPGYGDITPADMAGDESMVMPTPVTGPF